MRKPTNAELQARLNALQATEEAFRCLIKGEPRHTFTSADNRLTVEVIGLGRASGGVIISINEIPYAVYISEWCNKQRDSVDVYARHLADDIYKAYVTAIKARCA